MAKINIETVIDILTQLAEYVFECISDDGKLTVLEIIKIVLLFCKLLSKAIKES